MTDLKIHKSAGTSVDFDTIQFSLNHAVNVGYWIYIPGYPKNNVKHLLIRLTIVQIAI